MKFSQLISETIKSRQSLILLFSGLIFTGFVLLAIRPFIHTEKSFLFLFWNLFLALIPLVLSSMMLQMKKLNFSKSSILSIGFVWLIFFPNAPYVLTDFIHLSYGSLRHFWLDAMTITWFAVASLLSAIISLNDISILLGSAWKQQQTSFAILAISMLSGFGIYLGRYLRFNSWDVLNNPGSLAMEMADRVINPFDHPRTWMVTVGFGLLLFFVFKGIRFMAREMQVKQIEH